MKIAIPTDDGEYVSEKFGHAHYFLVLDEETREIELRHNEHQHSHQSWHGHAHQGGHRHKKVDKIAGILKDVDVIITSHIGKPMLDRMMHENKMIYISPKSIKISDALNLYFTNNLKKINKKPE